VMSAGPVIIRTRSFTNWIRRDSGSLFISEDPFCCAGAAEAVPRSD